MAEKNRAVLEASDIGLRVTKNFIFIFVYFATTAKVWLIAIVGITDKSRQLPAGL